MLKEKFYYLILYALVLLLSFSLVGFLSDIFWFFDLFNHFRPQAVVCGFILLLASIYLKDKKTISIALIILIINVSAIGERLYTFPVVEKSEIISASSEKKENISFIFSNVLTSNNNYQAFFQMIDKNSPDVLVLAEVNDQWLSEIHSNLSFPFYIEDPRQDNFGMAIFSNKPFKSIIYNVGEYKLPLIVAEFEDFVVIAIHPIPPVGKEQTKEIHTYMMKIAILSQQIQKPLILTGDFNSTLWSKSMTYLENLDLKRANKLGLAWTWPSGFFPLAVQIDHLFMRGISNATFETLPDIGSDHFPIMSKIVLNKNNKVER